MTDEATRLALQTEADLASLLARAGVVNGDDRRKLVWALDVVRRLAA